MPGPEAQSGSYMLTVDEVAKYLRVSRATICRWCGNGKMRAFKVGKGWRVQQQDLERYIQQQRLLQAAVPGDEPLPQPQLGSTPV